MSNDNGSAFERYSTIISNKTGSPSTINSLNQESTNGDLNEISQKPLTTTIIPLSDEPSETSLLSFNKRPYSSVKQLDLTKHSSNPCDVDNSSSNKRLKVNDDFKPSQNIGIIQSNPTSLYDSLRKSSSSPYSHLQRPSSRLSISSISSCSTTALGQNSRYIFATKANPSSQFFSKHQKDKNNLSTNEVVSGSAKSNFYTGKTTFGGANIRQSIRRHSTTPYALSRLNNVSVRSIEAKPSPYSKNINSNRAVNNEIQLSSVTQRVLESLEKAATPLTDAKRRFSSIAISTTRSPYHRLSNTPDDRFGRSSKLFDSPVPSVQNNGRCDVDFSYKPIKYILKTADDPDHKLVSDEIKKLNDIVSSEKLLENKNGEKNSEEQTKITQSKKSSTFGKITQRDVIKGRIFENNEHEDANETHFLDSLATVKPLSVPVTVVKPFALSGTCTISPKLSDNVDNLASPEDTSTEKPPNKLFQFSSIPKIGGFETFGTKLKSNEATPKFDESSNNKKTKEDLDGSWSDKFKPKGKEWELSSGSKPIVSETGKESSTNLNTNLSLFDQLKAKKNLSTWSCPTCCVDNEQSAETCIACEEPNPNKPKKVSSAVNSSDQFGFKFGAFSNPTSTQVTNSETKITPTETKIEPTSSLNHLFKKKSNLWSCPTCMIDNDPDVKACLSCEEPNPNFKGKSESTEFKFGQFSKPPVTSDESIIDNKTSTFNSVDNKANSSKWTCFYCKVHNDDNQQKCSECNKVKTLAATKDEVHKFYESQTFSFGFNNPALIADSKPNDNALSNKEPFKFHTPPLAKDLRDENELDNKKSLLVEKKTESSVKPNLFGDKVPSTFQFGSSTLQTEKSGEAKHVELSTTTSTVKFGENKFQISTEKPSFKFGLVSNTSPIVSHLSDDTIKSTTDTIKTTTNPTSTSSFSIVPDFNTKSTLTSIKSDNETSLKFPETSITTISSNNVPKNDSGKEQFISKLKDLNDSNQNLSEKKDDNTKNSLFNFEKSKPFSNLTSVPNSQPPATISNMFQFASNPSTTVTSNTLNFTFSSAPKTTESSTVSNSLFTFGATTTATTVSSTLPSTTSSTTLSLGSKNFNLGLPVSVPKIDIGPPVPNNSKVCISFSEANPVSSSGINSTAPPSIFTFGSQSTSSSVNETNSTKPDIKFNTNNFSANLPNKTTPSVPLFESSTVPMNFNFSSTAPNANTNSSSNTTLFSFGAKVENSNLVPSATPFNFQAPSLGATNPTPNSGFNFSQANPPPSSTFGGNLFGNSLTGQTPTQPQLATFGAPSFPQATASSAVNAVNPSVPFKFNAEPNLQTFVAPNLPGGNMFEFSATEQSSNQNRQIKKAKRRLRPL